MKTLGDINKKEKLQKQFIKNAKDKELKSEKKPVTLYLNPETIDNMKILAIKEKVKYSDIAEIAIIKYIESHNV